MYIKTIISQNRWDFQAVYQCEGCGYEETKSDYDDRHFYDNVVPNFKCKNCGKSRNDLTILEQEFSHF